MLYEIGFESFDYVCWIDFHYNSVGFSYGITIATYCIKAANDAPAEISPLIVGMIFFNRQDLPWK